MHCATYSKCLLCPVSYFEFSTCSISMEDTRQDGQHMGMEPRKVWSSRENLIAEISTLRVCTHVAMEIDSPYITSHQSHCILPPPPPQDQVNHLQQQNQELRRRSMSPRESGPASGTFSHSASPSPRRPLSYELEHPLTGKYVCTYVCVCKVH